MIARSIARQERQLHAAIVVQSCYRMYQARSAFQRKHKAALTIQSAYRGHVARHMAKEIR